MMGTWSGQHTFVQTFWRNQWWSCKPRGPWIVSCMGALNAFGGVDIALLAVWDIFSSSHIYYDGKDEYNAFPTPGYIIASNMIEMT